jgi:hypothetical protein
MEGDEGEEECSQRVAAWKAGVRDMAAAPRVSAAEAERSWSRDCIHVKVEVEKVEEGYRHLLRVRWCEIKENASNGNAQRCLARLHPAPPR